MSSGSIPDGKIKKNDAFWAVGNAKGNESEGNTLIKIEISNLGQNWQGLLLSTTSVAEGNFDSQLVVTARNPLVT